MYDDSTVTELDALFESYLIAVSACVGCGITEEEAVSFLMEEGG